MKKLHAILFFGALTSGAIQAAATLPWAGTEPDSGGNYSLPWLGTIHESESVGWVRHEQLGWMYASGDSPESVYLYKPGAGWLWTGKASAHYFYSWDLGGWVYYCPGTANPQWFYDYRHHTWVRDLMNGEEKESLDTALEAIVQKEGVPAIACAVVKKGKIVAQGQAGVIYNGSSIKVNANSRWLLGSITKSVTAILTAKLVEEGLVGWDETLPELLPDVKMNEQWNHVTLSELIHHTAGFDDAAIMQQVDASTLKGSPGEQRTQVASLILAGMPAWTPGTHYEYSSLDYVIIGAILERRAKQDYETLVSTKVLEPLGLYSHGFLNPAAGEDRESQPWGHFDGVPQDPDLPDTGVPPVLASTGGVNLTIEDLAYYAADNLSGEQGYCTVLTKDMWTKLHYETSAASTVYACGWEVGDFAQYLGAKDFSHSGCDNTFTTEVIAAPALDMCIVMSTNEGDENKSADALYDAFVMVLDHYGIDYGAK